MTGRIQVCIKKKIYPFQSQVGNARIENMSSKNEWKLQSGSAPSSPDPAHLIYAFPS